MRFARRPLILVAIVPMLGIGVLLLPDVEHASAEVASAPSTSGLASAPSISQLAAMGCVNLDPYSATAAQRSMCGDVTYPLTSITPDPVAGSSVTDYIYNINGEDDAMLYPASSFDPMTASPATLEVLGIPPRPDPNTAAYGPWVAQYGSKTASEWGTPAPFEVVDTYAPPATDKQTIWAGYSTSGYDYSESDGEWLQPIPMHSACTNDADYIWAGIGGATSSYLEQDGTSQGVSGIGMDQGWWADNTGAIHW